MSGEANLLVKLDANRQYLLLLLLLIFAFNSVDRLVLGLVAQNLEADLSLTDAQLGLLTGFAFAIFFSLMGVPLARWADRGNRVHLIAMTTLLWSIALALSGLAANFTQLILARTSVAVGEAGCVPASSSLLSDHFSQDERPRAMSRYLLGGSLGLVIGYLAGGWLNEWVGWRFTFAILGAPGVILAVLTWGTLKDPRCRVPEAKSPTTRPTQADPHGAPPSATLRETIFVLTKNRTFHHLLVCFSVMAFTGTGVAQWLPAFFIRRYGVATGELGTWLAVVYGASYAAGTYWGGELAARAAPNNERLQMRMMALSYAAAGVLASAVYLAPSFYLGIALVGLSAILSALSTGPLLAVVQAIVPGRLRAQATALVFLFGNLIGLGLGPWAVGMLSDQLKPSQGDTALRDALLIMSPTYLWAAWHLWQSSQTVVRDVFEAKSQPSALALGAEPPSPQDARSRS